MLLVSLFILPIFTACAPKETTVNDGRVSNLKEWVAEGVIESYEDGDIDAADIIVDQICFGSFSQDGASEIFAICKILNTPHVGGLDQRACILLEADTWEIVAYKLFRADETVIECLQTSSGQSRVLFLGTGENHGMRSQVVELYAIQGSEWVNLPIDIMQSVPLREKEKLEGDCFCYVADNRMAVIYEDDPPISSGEDIYPSELIAILIWDPETEQFVPKL